MLHLNLCCCVLLQELWLEYVDRERLQYDEREVLSLWEKVQSEPTFVQAQNPDFPDNTSLSNGTELKNDTLYPAVMLWQMFNNAD